MLGSTTSFLHTVAKHFFTLDLNTALRFNAASLIHVMTRAPCLGIASFLYVTLRLPTPWRLLTTYWRLPSLRGVTRCRRGIRTGVRRSSSSSSVTALELSYQRKIPFHNSQSHRTTNAPFAETNKSHEGARENH